MLEEFYRSYAQLEQPFARTQLVLFMMGMGATLSVSDFTIIFRKPRSLSVGLAGQLLLIPVVAFLVGKIAGLSPGVITGLVMVASLPGGNISKMFTFLARGNVALSITMSACATLLCIVTIPLVFKLLLPEVLESADSTRWVELEIVAELAFFLILPVVLGMLFARFWPKYQKVFSKWMIRLGFVIAGFMVLGSLGSGRIEPFSKGWMVPVTIIIFCILAQQLPMLPFRFLKWPDKDCVSVGIESTMRNINLALALLALLFPPGSPNAKVGSDVLFVALYYGGTAFFLGIPLVVRMRRVIRRQELEHQDSLQEVSDRLATDEKSEQDDKITTQPEQSLNEESRFTPKSP